MSELALAAFAAETGMHLVDEPRGGDFRAFRRRFDADGYAASLSARGIRWIGRAADLYPPLLAALPDPPPGLFLRGSGDPELLRGRLVAIVGARACSSYGAEVARMLGRDVAAAGVVVVSGLARGIDGAAHRGALEAGGTTIAVLGCGIDRDYPAAHRELASRICGSGAVVSEYAPGVEPAPWRFPARNRIIAGLAEATIIVEARERSGALITAEFALEAGREVFAVPGQITSALSLGTNGLLRAGAAAPLLGADDVLAELGVEPSAPAGVELSEPARVVLERLGDSPGSADELTRATGLDAATIAAALAELELAGQAAGADGVYRGVRPQG